MTPDELTRRLEHDELTRRFDHLHQLIGIELRRVEQMANIRIDQLEARVRALEKPQRLSDVQEAIDQQLALIDAERKKSEPESIREMLARIESKLIQLVEDHRQRDPP